MDLFSGPEKYEDGTDSTPIIVLKMAIQNEFLRDKLVTLFNDEKEEYINCLIGNIKDIPGIDSLKFRPDIFNSTIDDEIAEQIRETELYPTFSFVDPFGYKGVSRKLIGGLIKDWGSDCVFFFNYRKINPAINNPVIINPINELFGKNIAKNLRETVSGYKAKEREQIVIESMCDSLQEAGAKYILPFRFVASDKDRTSHHLFFVSKNVLGYSIMKEIMAKESTDSDQGVARFEYNPSPISQGRLFDYSLPLRPWS
jgi:three-Cys-motif partner protein